MASEFFLPLLQNIKYVSLVSWIIGSILGISADLCISDFYLNDCGPIGRAKPMSTLKIRRWEHSNQRRWEARAEEIPSFLSGLREGTTGPNSHDLGGMPVNLTYNWQGSKIDQ